MGKKKKKKRKQKKYNKNQFIDIVCKQCKMCEQGYNPIFCWDGMYKQAPGKFMGYCYGQLIKTHDQMKRLGLRASQLNHNEFSSIFCDSDICGDEATPCGNRCFFDFRAQLLGSKISVAAHKRKKRKKEKFVCEAYPTFIASAGMQADVKKILENADS